MASSIASHVYLGDDTLEGLEIYIPKQTTIDKIGGILCHICNSIFGNKKDYDSHYALHKIDGAEIVYTCVACKKQISGYPSFRGHCYLKHVVKNKFQCEHCSKIFSKLSILNTHVSAVHDYKCVSCDDKFTSKKDLETHKIVHGTTKKGLKMDPPYECIMCSQVITTVDDCESHIDDHCEILYPCPICKEIISNKLKATEHLAKHFDENIPNNILAAPQNIIQDSSIDILGGILCCHCDLLFPNRLELDCHFIEKHEEKSIVYTCNICGKQYEKYTMFGDHCHLHISKDRFQCDQCEKSFPRLSLLVLHTEAFHARAAHKPFSCAHCGHGFMTRQRLRDHVRIVHEQEPTLRCLEPGCSATFRKPRELVLHAKQHALVPDTWCRACGLQFAHAAAAARHLDVHRRTQYSCPVCRRAYRERYSVLKHVHTHFAQVLHVCKTCGKAYGARNRLVAHLKTHVALRSFACDLCPKSFVKPHELRQHLNVHSGLRPFLCSLCPKRFASQPNWTKHLTRIHALDKPTVRRLREDRPVSPSASPSGEPCAFADSDSGETKLTAQTMSIAESVSSTVDSLGDYLDLGSVEHCAIPEAKDDASDIKAIVEHIDAMSEGIKPEQRPQAHGDGVVDAGIEFQYVDMMPIEDVVFDTFSDSALCNLGDNSHRTSSWFPEYGPESTGSGLGLGLGLGVGGEGFSLEEHALPHIDPRLTIRAKDNVKMYLQNINTFGFNDIAAPAPPALDPRPALEPHIITKLFKYEDNNDANRMYIF